MIFLFLIFRLCLYTGMGHQKDMISQEKHGFAKSASNNNTLEITKMLTRDHRTLKKENVGKKKRTDFKIITK